MKVFIDKNNLMYSLQYGFRKSHSTEHAVLDIVEDILRNIWINGTSHAVSSLT